MPSAKNKPARHLNGPRWATPDEVAAYLGITTRTVREMENDGRLRAYRGFGNRMLRFDLNEIDASLAGGARQA
jgi:excisionase family DNA binding protein